MIPPDRVSKLKRSRWADFHLEKLEKYKKKLEKYYNKLQQLSLRPIDKILLAMFFLLRLNKRSSLKIIAKQEQGFLYSIPC